MYENVDTNRNWYYLKNKHTYIKTYIWVYKKSVNIDTNWKDPMISIETTIISSVYLISYPPKHVQV